MSVYIVDVEADGPCPGLYSMVQVGAVKVTPALDTHFVRDLKPMTDIWVPEALAACNMTREQTLTYGDPEQAVKDFRDWVVSTTVDKPVLVSDNPGFDAAYVNYYFTYFLGVDQNPFGFSSRRIGDFYAGLTRGWKNGSRWKGLRVTKHTHNAKDDAMGNAEALMKMAENHDINVNWV